MILEFFWSCGNITNKAFFLPLKSSIGEKILGVIDYFRDVSLLDDLDRGYCGCNGPLWAAAAWTMKMASPPRLVYILCTQSGVVLVYSNTFNECMQKDFHYTSVYVIKKPWTIRLNRIGWQYLPQICFLSPLLQLFP